MDKMYLTTVLEDDNTPQGGTSYQGETLEEFLTEAGINSKDITLTEVNQLLQENGIKPVNL